jgi:SAM-dependent methyltransferase
MITSTHSTKSDSSDSGSLIELKEYYKSSESYRAHLEAKGASYFQQFVEVISACSSPTDLILDLGCGTGESTREIMRHERRVIGADISQMFMRKDCTSTPSPVFIASDASQLPFADQSFDVVSAMEFIEHVWPVDPVLCEMDRVTKPGGRIVLMSPNLLSPLWPWRDLPAMLLHARFRPPFYSSYGDAAVFWGQSCLASLSKILSREPHFVRREPDLRRADHGGDFDSVYASNARDLMLFLRRAGYKVELASGLPTSFRSHARRLAVKCLGSLWTSFLLKATKLGTPGS